MHKLERADQLILAHARCKRGSAYLEDSGEQLSAKENELLDLFDQFVSQPSSLEIELQSRRLAGETVKMASKGKLRKATVSKFIEAFGSTCVEMKLGAEWDPLFQMKCCGWIIATQLTFGRHRPLVNYRHMIVSETRVAHPQNSEIIGPALTLSPGVAWLVNRWEDILEEDVDTLCNALVKQAGYFFNVAPRLLAGLDCEQTGQP
jgi:hypothetical protein